jgi:hypothetical protein
MTRRNDLNPRALSESWDRQIAAGVTDSGSDSADVVVMMFQAGTFPPLDPQVEGDIWNRVLAGAVQGTHLSGRLGTDPSLKVNPMAVVVWAVISGAVGGFVGGISARLAMRLAGFLTDDRNRFMLTDNGNRVGEITFDGTMFLAGAAAGVGIALSLLYVSVRSYLPGNWMHRSALWSVLFLATLGFVVMDPENPDYHRFGPATFNVIVFSSLYLVIGFATSAMVEWGFRFQPIASRMNKPLGRRTEWLVNGASLPVLAIGALVCLSGTIILGGPTVLVVGTLFVLARLTDPWLQRVRSLPSALQSQGLLVVPALLGFALTLSNIVEILTGQ